MKFKESAMEVINDLFVGALDLFPYDTVIETLHDWATVCGLWIWRTAAVTQSATTGGLLMAIPGVSLLIGVSSDLTSLFYGMQATAYGVGAIIAKRNGLSDFSLSKEDYVDVLAVWAGAPEFILDAQAKGVLYLVGKSAGKAGIKASVKTTSFVAASSMSKKIGIPISSPLLEKVVVKICGKLGIKASALVPAAGVFINAGINAWFVYGISKAAEQYYVAKFEGRKI